MEQIQQFFNNNQCEYIEIFFIHSHKRCLYLFHIENRFIYKERVEKRDDIPFEFRIISTLRLSVVLTEQRRGPRKKTHRKVLSR
jgi:hypothetical protein